MHPLVRLSCSLAPVALLISAQPLGAPAAGPGLAYDAVMKFQMGQESGADPVPGTFETDFAAASAPAKPAGHMPFGLGKMVSSLQNVGSMFKTGTATRHYFGAGKFREDNIAAGTGDITDCSARTITHLDFNAKTYHVTSLDQPQSAETAAPSHREAPGPAPTDDGTKVAMSMTSRALGPMTISGVATNGYNMNIRMTVTKADGESATSNEDLTAYYSGIAEPVGSCPAAPIVRPSSAGSGPNAAAMSQLLMAMTAVNSKGDSRFKISTSGPPLPSGKLALWELIEMKGAQGQAGGIGLVTERGDVHPIADSDPAFSVPPDYAKV